MTSNAPGCREWSVSDTVECVFGTVEGVLETVEGVFDTVERVLEHGWGVCWVGHG